MSNFYRFRGYEFSVDVEKVKKILRKKRSPYGRRTKKTYDEQSTVNEAVEENQPTRMNNSITGGGGARFSQNNSMFKYPLLSFEESSAKSYKQSYYKAQQKILNLEKRNDELEKDLIVKERENNDLLGKIRLMRKAFKDNYDIYTTRMNDRESEREIYLKENIEIKKKLKKFQVTRIIDTQKRETLGELRTEIKELQSEVDRLKILNEESEIKTNYYRESLERIEKKLKSDEDMEDSMFLSRLEDMVKQKAQIYEEDRKELSDYTIDIQKKLSSKHEEVKKLRKTIRSLREVCETLRKRIKEMKKTGGSDKFSFLKGKLKKGKGKNKNKKFLPQLGEDSKYRVAVSDL